MASIIHRAESRGQFKIDWLDSRHTFSFGEYYNPDRMGFGKLRVINDDIVLPSKGFDTHPHRNMEIVSIPLLGALEHQDSEGNQHIIKTGDIQLMSAGTGIAHSEYNHSHTEPVNFLQIWIEPQTRGTSPRYDQYHYQSDLLPNVFNTVISPIDTHHPGIKINQQAYFSILECDADVTLNYQKKHKDNGIYFFVIAGSFAIHSEAIRERDGMGITEIETILIKSQSKGTLLAIEVPTLE